MAHSLFTFCRSCFFLLSILSFLSGCNLKKSEEKNQPAPPASEYDQIPLIQNLTKKIAEDAGEPDLYYERGAAYYQLGNYANALADVTQALRLDSANAGYYELLGEIYFSKQEYTRAVTALERGRKIAPEDVDLMMQLAKYNLYVGERQKSIQLLDEVLKKNMFNADAYFLKGMIFKEIGDTAKSVSNFQTAVEQNPQYYNAYMQLGLLLSKKKDRLALDYFNNALKLDSSSYEVRYGIAMYYQEIKDYPKALQLYREMILDFPQDKDAYYNSGYIYFQLDSFGKADRNFERALGVEPTYADAYYMRGLCAEARKDFKSARYFYQQTLNLKPEHALASEGIKRLGDI